MTLVHWLARRDPNFHVEAEARLLQPENEDVCDVDEAAARFLRAVVRGSMLSATFNRGTEAGAS